MTTNTNLPGGALAPLVALDNIPQPVHEGLLVAAATPSGAVLAAKMMSRRETTWEQAWTLYQVHPNYETLSALFSHPSLPLSSARALTQNLNDLEHALACGDNSETLAGLVQDALDDRSSMPPSVWKAALKNSAVPSGMVTRAALAWEESLESRVGPPGSRHAWEDEFTYPLWMLARSNPEAFAAWADQSSSVTAVAFLLGTEELSPVVNRAALRLLTEWAREQPLGTDVGSAPYPYPTLADAVLDHPRQASGRMGWELLRVCEERELHYEGQPLTSARGLSPGRGTVPSTQATWPQLLQASASLEWVRVAADVGEHLGPDPAAWAVLASVADTFTGTPLELIGVVQGILSSPAPS